MAVNHSSAMILRRHIGASVDLLQLLDVTHIERGLRLGELDIVIVDPEEVSVEFFAALVIVVDQTSAILLIWTPFSPRVAELLIHVSSRSSVEILFRDLDDDRAIFLHVLRHAHHESVRRSVLRYLSPRMQRLPPQASVALIRLVVCGREVSSVSQVARMSGISRRTLERHLRANGFSGAAVLVRCARLLRVREELLRGDQSVEAAALAAGFPSSRALQQSCHRVLGTSPSEIRRRMTASAFVEGILKSALGDVRAD
jgi:AraC-like DNA-binding protein